MDLLAQILVNGILLGGLYAVMALGLALVWGVLNIVNLAHGAFIMLGAYVSWYLYHLRAYRPVSAALPITAAVMFAHRLRRPARPSEPDRPRADVQHAADHLRARGRADLSGAARVLGRLPHHQSRLCRATASRSGRS